jgi:hypothetical protein
LRADSMADSYESVMNFGISAHYSPNVGEEEFCELRHDGVLRSSAKRLYEKWFSEGISLL